jgi:hypothetical protein
MNTDTTKAAVLAKIEGLDHIPTIPAVLAPLLRYLEQPMEQLDVHRVTDMIAQDKSLAAQCLQMANSPLFGRWQKIDSLRAAIVGLGFQRVSDIAMSCGVLNLTPKDGHGIDPIFFGNIPWVAPWSVGISLARFRIPIPARPTSLDCFTISASS